MINRLMRYQVVDSANQVIALTLTKWTARLLSKTMNDLGSVGLTPFSVLDGNAQPLEEEEDD